MMAKSIWQYQITANSNYKIGEEVLDEDKRLVTQLGIQAPPGTLFKINKGGEIEIGKYGIYELDLSNGLGLINSIIFTKLNGAALIDTVYDKVKDGAI